MVSVLFWALAFRLLIIHQLSSGVVEGSRAALVKNVNRGILPEEPIEITEDLDNLPLTTVRPSLVGFLRKFTRHPPIEISEELGITDEVETTTEEVCEDRIPNCEASKDLCKEELYRQIMVRECARTCGFCDEPEDECEDKDPDCSRRNQLCEKPMYREIMKENCPRTCGYCAIFDMQKELKAKKAAEIEALKRRTKCRDNVSNCRERSYLCKRQAYARQMARDCRKTCHLC